MDAIGRRAELLETANVYESRLKTVVPDWKTSIHAPEGLANLLDEIRTIVHTIVERDAGIQKIFIERMKQIKDELSGLPQMSRAFSAYAVHSKHV
jgi:hypothetical protein